MWQKGFWKFLNFKHDCNFRSDYTVQEHFSSPWLNILNNYAVLLRQIFEESAKEFLVVFVLSTNIFVSKLLRFNDLTI